MRATEPNRRFSRQGRTNLKELARSIAGLCAALCVSLGVAEAADYKYVRFHDEFVVEADGSFVETYEVQEIPLTRSAVDDMGQVDISYSANLADLEVLEAYVRKSDGRRIDVPPDAMRLQDDAASNGAPTFTDEKHRIILFPQLEPEDRIVYKVRIRQRVAYFPGHFLENWNFAKDVEVDDVRVDISMPAARPLHVDLQGFVADKERRDGDRIRYGWTYRNPEAPDLNKRYAVSSIDYGARLHVSTMADYKELAAAYEARAADKAVPTDEIRRLAEDLTKGVSDRREQARRLYDWVNL